VAGALLVLGVALAIVGVGREGPGGPTVRRHLIFMAELFVGQLLFNLLLQADLTLLRFFAGEAAARPQVFFSATDLVELAGGKISYRQVGRDLTGHQLQILHERYAVGADTGEAMLRHESQEGGVVLRGKLEVTVGDQRRTLGPGDAFYFDSRLPHRFRNPGSEECEVVTACTPPSF
jgi:mannose-6-phosphate isomerase-like protein (cupin superfamily)